MGWCYTFGVRCGAGCNDPMVVREGSSTCGCASCGAICRGQFSNCHEIVFRPGGLDFQLRCLPDEVLAHLGQSLSSSRRNETMKNAHLVIRDSGARSDTTPSAAQRLSSQKVSANLSPTPPVSTLSLGELHAGFVKLIETTAAINLSVAKLEAEVASLRRDLTALSAAVLDGGLQHRAE